MLNSKGGCQFLLFFIYLFSSITIVILCSIILFLVIGSLNVFNLEFLISMIPSLFNTLFLLLIALILATPISVMCAIHLQFYAQKTKLVKFINFTIDCLSGIPSIIFGLFALSFFVYFIGLPKSILAGALSVTILVLPIITKNSQEAIKNVKQEYIDASFALGATKFDTVKRIIIPESIDGIITGLILAIGRIIGETAAILFVAGTVDQFATSFISPGITLSNKLLMIIQEPTYSSLGIQEAYAIALLLVFIVIILNILIKVTKKLLRKKF